MLISAALALAYTLLTTVALARTTKARSPTRVSLVERMQLLPVASVAAVWLGFVSGSVLLAYSYSYASTHSDADRMHFHLFWLAELLFLVPALIRLLQWSASRASRLTVVIAIAAFDYAPKYLRDPHFPLFHDELIHSHQVASISSAGQLFEPSPVIGIIRFFPGLHSAAVSFEKLSGASPFLVQSLLLLTLHVLALIGIFLIAEQLTRSVRVAGLAAFVYALNPSFLFFDVQFSYESLGIVLFVWVIVALVKAEAATYARERAGWLTLGFLLALACVVTHHISSYALTLMLVFIGVVALFRARKANEGLGDAAGVVFLAVAVAAAATGWLLLIAGDVYLYLSPHVEGGVHQVISLVHREQQSRTLFAKSTTPSYEHAAAFVSPIIAFVGAVAGLLLLRRRSTRGSVAQGLIVLGFLYFASLPFIYTQAGAEGARRSWGFTYIGLSLLLALAMSELTTRGRARGRTLSIAALTATVALAVLLHLGNVASGVNQFYRFPGPPSVRSEIRALTPEVRSAAGWLERTQGPNRKIVADQYAGPPLAYFGRARPATPSDGFRTWELYLSHPPPTRLLAGQLRSSHHDYLFVNGSIPLRASYYQTQTATASGSSAAVPFQTSIRPSSSVIATYDRTPWALKLYGTNNLAIYRLDYPALEASRSDGRRHRRGVRR